MKLHRSRDKMIAGVCSGIAETYGWDVSLVRIIFAIFALLHGAGILIYLVAWFVMPEK